MNLTRLENGSQFLVPIVDELTDRTFTASTHVQVGTCSVNCANPITHQTRRWLTCLLLIAALPQYVGCSRMQHRIRADQEVYSTIAERNCDPRWAVDNVAIDMDPRSRYFDQYDPDCPPMPNDDPASHCYMQCVNGKRGWKHWNRNGVRGSLENPDWRARLAEYTEMTDDYAVKLDVDSAVRLAYMHSPLHQRNLENLYLSSLDVTGERFLLDTQFFGGTVLGYNHTGTESPATIAFDSGTGQYVVAGPFNVAESNRLGINNSIEARRRFATAGEVLIGFANSIAFEFTGGDVSLASSLANFSFIQPLLRGAGRDVALEQLTLSERRLLGNLRAYSQFRQGFFTQIVIGELGVVGPQRFGGGTVLQSFSGFGGVGGYLGLLQQAQQIRNTEENLRLQLRTLDRLEALYDNELIDIVQVDQFRQNIEATRANLLDQTNALELAIDNYKTQILGLPPDLRVQLDEELVKQFQLIPTESATLLESLLSFQNQVGNIGELVDLAQRVEILDEQLETLPKQDLFAVDRTLRRLQGLVEAAGRRLRGLPESITAFEKNRSAEASRLSSKEQKALERVVRLAKDDSQKLADHFVAASEQLERFSNELNEENFRKAVENESDTFAELLSLCRGIVIVQSEAQNVAAEPEEVLDRVEQFVAPVRELLAGARDDLKRLNEIAPDRMRGLSPDEKARFNRDRERLTERLADLETGELGFEVKVKELKQLRDSYSPETRTKTLRELTAWIQSYLQLVERLALVPAQARLELIAVDQVELDPDLAFQIALENRLDFMNGRAALVDRWRTIQVAADALQSDLTITGAGDVRTSQNNPVDFRDSTSNIRLGIEFDAPLARLLERNGYRETLIEYQRSRRDLIQSHDSLQLGLRALLRTLKQRKLQLEIQRRAVAIALRRVDQTQLSLLSPPPQSQPGVRPQINPTTAINLLGAQGSLQSAQNSFLAAWLDYYATRLRLYRELGVMQLEPSGHWIENPLDFGYASDIEVQALEPLPPAVPIEALEPLNNAELPPFNPNVSSSTSPDAAPQSEPEQTRSFPAQIAQRGLERILRPFGNAAKAIGND